MATQRKKKAAKPKRVATVKTNEYSQLEMYCIWLNEFYEGLRTAGFKHDIALAIMMDKDSYPAWVDFRIPTDIDVNKYLDEDED